MSNDQIDSLVRPQIIKSYPETEAEWCDHLMRCVKMLRYASAWEIRVEKLWNKIILCKLQHLDWLSYCVWR
jgi:hypothetical protein